jgi:hypothetical protein
LYPRRRPPSATPPSPHRVRPPEHPPGPHNRQIRAFQAPSQSPHDGCTQSCAPAPSRCGDDDRQTTIAWNQAQTTLILHQAAPRHAASQSNFPKFSRFFRVFSRFFRDFSRYTAGQISGAAPVGTTHKWHGVPAFRSPRTADRRCGAAGET